MIKIEPTPKSVPFQASKPQAVSQTKQEKTFTDAEAILLTLTGLGILATAAICLMKKPSLNKSQFITFEKALEKNGVQVKNNVATVVNTGEKFTGKIQRLESKNRKETVEFTNGIIKEKIYHDASGNELNGYFYQNGELRLHVNVAVNKTNNEKSFSYCEHAERYGFTRGDGFLETGSAFDWARNYLKEYP